MALVVLVLHAIDDFENERNTSIAHVTALERYTKGHQFVYHHIKDDITDELRAIPFDIVWVDVTFLCWRWVRPREEFVRIRAKFAWIGGLDAYRVACPQDDYDHADNLDAWLVELGIDLLMSWTPDRLGELLPRTLASGAEIMQSLTGYVDDEQVVRYGVFRRPFSERRFDVSYRVRRVPPNIGRFGILKSEFGRAFAAIAEGRLAIDISDDPAKTLVGSDWPAFLGDSRYVLGCEGGASIIDARGELRDRIDDYRQMHPDAAWESIYRETGCAEHEIEPLAALTPRLFEIAMTGACPILIEGHYDGFVEPGRDYISVRRDFSNIEDVIEKLGDWDRGQRIAEHLERTLLSDPTLRYRSWAQTIMQRAEQALAKHSRGTVDELRRRQLLSVHHRKAISHAARRAKGHANLLRDEIGRLQDEIGRLTGVIDTLTIQSAELNTTYRAEIDRLNQEIIRIVDVYQGEIARRDDQASKALPPS